MRIKRRSKPWRGLLAGAAAGLAAAFLMGPLRALAQKASPKKQKQDEEDSTVKTAAAISVDVFDHRLTRREKKIAGPVVHYLFGTGLGAIYGVAAETIPSFAPDADHFLGRRYG